MPAGTTKPTEMTVHLLWLNAGLSCDGDSVSLTNAQLPSVEDIVMGAIPGVPRLVPHWPLVDYRVGDDFIQWFWKADAGELDPFGLVVEGSIPNEDIKSEYYEQGDFAHEYGSPKCLVKIGCLGPVVRCNVAKRGWMDGIGGCPNVGGICIACTMPGFPDKFMPFMDEPRGGKISTTVNMVTGGVPFAVHGTHGGS